MTDKNKGHKLYNRHKQFNGEETKQIYKKISELINRPDGKPSDSEFKAEFLELTRTGEEIQKIRADETEMLHEQEKMRADKAEEELAQMRQQYGERGAQGLATQENKGSPSRKRESPSHSQVFGMFSKKPKPKEKDDESKLDAEPSSPKQSLQKPFS